MFTKYEIRKVNGEDILYLYLSYDYEFSRELTDTNEDDLKILSKQFLNKNSIPYHGNKVYFVLDGMVVKKVNFPDNHEYYFSPDNYMINIKLEDGSNIEISLKEYLLSILFSYYDKDFDKELYKAICVLYNTYAYRMMAEDGFILANNNYARYKPLNEYKDIDNYDSISNLFRRVIEEVSCLFISYNMEYILPFIHYSNNGETLAHPKYLYLSSVKSLWDITSPNYLNIKTYSFNEISNIFKVQIDSSSEIKLLNHGHTIKIKHKAFSIREVKDLLKLLSCDISIIVNRDNITFITKGIGNNLGLSLYGYNSLAKNGANYEQILYYYFPKCRLFKNIKELSL